jgi:hypothetical protein
VALRKQHADEKLSYDNEKMNIKSVSNDRIPKAES